MSNEEINAREPTKRGAAIEALAEYSHAAWSDWMEYLFLKCDGSHTIPAPLVLRWKRQLYTPYADLPDDEKQSYLRDAERTFFILSAMGIINNKINEAQNVKRNDENTR